MAQEMLYWVIGGEIVLAIPVSGDEIAPRFNSANWFLIVDMDRGNTHAPKTFFLPDISWSCRLQQLSEVGVTVLLCGGFNRRFLPFAKCLGIRVLPGYRGTSENIIAAFFKDEDHLEEYRLFPRADKQGSPTTGELYK
jgi:predicted Fe-Mo cluster-binding NifX family protein